LTATARSIRTWACYVLSRGRILCFRGSFSYDCKRRKLVSITRIGTSKKYASNWAQAFGQKKTSRGQTPRTLAKKKTATAKKPSSKK
jgi:hypothetical protein